MIEDEVREKIDFIEIKKLIKENIKRISIVLLVFIILGVIYTFLFVKPTYRTTATILIDRSDTAISELISNDILIEEVSKELAIDYKKIKKSIDAIYTRNAKTIQIYVNYENNKESYNIANKYIEVLENKLITYYNVEQYDIIDKTEIAEKPSNINHVVDILKFLLLGILVSLVYIISLKLREGITCGNEIEQTGIRFLGKIEKKSDNIREGLERIITNIELNNKKRNPKVILIAEINNENDESEFISKIAEEYKAKDKKVLILDGRFEDKTKNYKKDIDVKTARELGININKLTKKESLNIIENLKRENDIILIDSVPILENTTATVWSNISDVAILVVRYRKTKEKQILIAKKYIKDVNGKILGAILEE